MTLLIKLGGNAVSGDSLPAVAADIAQLVQRGERVLVVHGGGPQTSALQRSLGQTPRRVGGRRITDEATLDAIKMMVGGKLNIDVCEALLALDLQPVGLNGTASLLIEARRRPPRHITGGGEQPVDLGLVGDVVGVNGALLELLFAAGHVPVVACIGASRAGHSFNINADVVANRLAQELQVEALILVSDIPGVLRDVADPTSRIGRMTEADARQAIADGVVTDGMIPKLEESFHTLRGGVQRVHILGQLQAGQLCAELADPGSVGTMLHEPAAAAP